VSSFWLTVLCHTSVYCRINIGVVISAEARRENIVDLVEEAPTSGMVFE